MQESVASLPVKLDTSGGIERSFTRMDNGPWTETIRPRQKRMSRRERNLLEREKALARSRQNMAQTNNVSAATEVVGGQGVAESHVGKT